MAFSLGRKKKQPPTDTQIRKHKEQVRVHKQWSHDVGQIRAISANLAEAYRSHKGDFALGRYEELKQMIKGAIQEFRDLQSSSKSSSYQSQASGKRNADAIASKYSNGGGGGGAGSRTQQQNNNTGNGTSSSSSAGGFLAMLKEKAASLTSTFSSSSSSTDTSQSASEQPTSASTRPTPKPTSQRLNNEDAKDKEMETWGYEGRNAKEIEEETESMRKEVLQLKKDYRNERDKFEHLAKEYEDSKKHAPPHRYTLLKDMIKDHVEA